MFDTEEDAAHQNREGLVPVLNGDVLYCSHGAAKTRVVVGDVEAPELFDRTLDHRLHVFLRTDVGLLKNCVAAVFLALAHHRLAARDIEIRHHH